MPTLTPLTLLTLLPAVSVPATRPVTATELRKLPPDAQRLARLAALDAFLRHICPRAPTEAEVRATAARLLPVLPPAEEDGLDGLDALDALAA